MQKHIFLLLIFIGSTFTTFAQSDSFWKTLAKVTYTKKYDEVLGMKVDIPVFSKDVTAYKGKEVKIKGYIVPIDGYKNHKEFILSAYPYNMCFFCGQAGPETVLEVVAKEAIKYTAEAIIIKGTLKLNDSDVNSLMYSLENVVLSKE
jgi:hypothetical protein